MRITTLTSINVFLVSLIFSKISQSQERKWKPTFVECSEARLRLILKKMVDQLPESEKLDVSKKRSMEEVVQLIREHLYRSRVPLTRRLVTRPWRVNQAHKKTSWRWDRPVRKKTSKWRSKRKRPKWSHKWHFSVGVHGGIGAGFFRPFGVGIGAWWNAGMYHSNYREKPPTTTRPTVATTTEHYCQSHPPCRPPFPTPTNYFTPYPPIRPEITPDWEYPNAIGVDYDSDHQIGYSVKIKRKRRLNE